MIISTILRLCFLKDVIFQARDAFSKKRKGKGLNTIFLYPRILSCEIERLFKAAQGFAFVFEDIENG